MVFANFTHPTSPVVCCSSQYMGRSVNRTLCCSRIVHAPQHRPYRDTAPNQHVFHILTLLIANPLVLGSLGQAFHHLFFAFQKSDIADSELSSHGLPPSPSGNQPSVAPTAKERLR
jgi:hypothetical protein